MAGIFAALERTPFAPHHFIQRLRMGPLRVLVVARSPRLRDSLARWLADEGRVRVIAALPSSAEVREEHRASHLVVASGLDGRRELRAIADRIGRHPGLVALTIAPRDVPRGWVPVTPGTERSRLLEHARAMPRSIEHMGERTVISAAVWSLPIGIVAAASALAYVPAAAVSWQRAALAYAERFPDAGTWWHTWGGGAPYLAGPAWPLLKLAGLGSLGPATFVVLAAGTGAMCAAALFFAARRVVADWLAATIALLVALGPALWAWARGGDAASAMGLAGVMLTIAAAGAGRQFLVATALAVAAAAPGGYIWVALATLSGLVTSVRTHHVRAGTVGVVLGIALGSSVTLPALLATGLEAVIAPLARPIALSDFAAPVVCMLAFGVIALWRLGQMASRRLIRIGVLPLGIAMVVAANGLALLVPPSVPEPPIAARSPHLRVAAPAGRALALLTTTPELSTTGDAVQISTLLGREPRARTQARLEWLAVDRAMVPDRASAIIFNERDWPLVDRERLVMGAPAVRPILTTASTAAVLVAADDQHAGVLSEALLELGSTSDFIIPVRSIAPLEQLDRATLRKFGALFVYGRPWTDLAAATKAIQDYLDGGGTVILDPAGLAGEQPILPDAEAIEQPARFASKGERGLITSEEPLAGGKVLAIPPFDLGQGLFDWEHAALLAGDRRVIIWGRSGVGLLIWSGADLPRRMRAGDATAAAHFQRVLSWGLQGLKPSGPWPKPDGPVYETPSGKVTFVDPARWRIELKIATTGILFKENYHPRWRAFQVDEGLQVTRTPLQIFPTTHGLMYVAPPANARVVEFVFERHPAETAARGVSGIAAFIIAVTAFFVWRRVRA